MAHTAIDRREKSVLHYMVQVWEVYSSAFEVGYYMVKVVGLRARLVAGIRLTSFLAVAQYFI